jgi:hypothetical protein
MHPKRSSALQLRLDITTDRGTREYLRGGSGVTDPLKPLDQQLNELQTPDSRCL